jgi:hypothetical protein
VGVATLTCEEQSSLSYNCRLRAYYNRLDVCRVFIGTLTALAQLLCVFFAYFRINQLHSVSLQTAFVMLLAAIPWQKYFPPI